MKTNNQDLSTAEMSPFPPEEAIEELSDIAVRILCGAEVYKHQYFNPNMVRFKLGGQEQILHTSDFEIAKWAADTIFRERIQTARLELMTKSLPYMLECRKWIRNLLSEYYHEKMNKVRVIMLRGDNTGCGFWRIKLPGYYLKDNEQSKLSIHITDVAIGFEKLVQYDVIVVQRVYDFEQFYTLEMLKNAGKKIVYEIDDDVFHIEDHNPASAIFNRFDAQICIRHCLALADLVVVSTERLAKALGVENKCIVYPNSIDWDTIFSFKSKDPNRTKKRIFWSGSNTHNMDFVECSDALLKIFEERNDVELHLMGCCPNIVKKTLSNYMDRVFLSSGMHTESYFLYLRSQVDADIGIVPVQNTIFNHSKSTCKCLEYTIAQLPIVASAYPPYSDVYTHGENALLCKSTKEWYENINMLLENSQMREDLIKKARKIAVEKFHLKKNAEKLGEAIENLGLELLIARNEKRNCLKEDSEVVPNL